MGLRKEVGNSSDVEINRSQSCLDYGERVGLNVGVLMCLVNDNLVPYLTFESQFKDRGRYQADRDKNSIGFTSNKGARGCGSVVAKFTELARISHSHSVTGTCRPLFSQAESAFPTKPTVWTKQSENPCFLQAAGSQREREKSKLVSWSPNSNQKISPPQE